MSLSLYIYIYIYISQLSILKTDLPLLYSIISIHKENTFKIYCFTLSVLIQPPATST